MKLLIKPSHRPLCHGIMLPLFVLPVSPLAIFMGIEFHDVHEKVLQNTAALLTAHSNEMKSKPDIFHELYQGNSERLANIPETETIGREVLTGKTHA